MIFNLTFISFYQNILLWLTACPSLVVWAVANSDKCSGAKVRVRKKDQTEAVVHNAIKP